MSNINQVIVDDYKESITEVQEAIKGTLGEKHSQHPGIVGSILQGIQIKRVADLMEMNHLDSEGEEDLYEEENEDMGS